MIKPRELCKKKSFFNFQIKKVWSLKEKVDDRHVLLNIIRYWFITKNLTVFSDSTGFGVGRVLEYTVKYTSIVRNESCVPY